MRFSGQAIKQMYIDKPYVQDVIETALMSGGHIGKKIDQVAPHALDPYKSYLPVTRDGSAAYLKHMRKGTDGSNNEAARGLRDLLQAKRNLSSPDAGTAEAMLSYYLRNRADNIAQGGYALVSPFFTGGDQENA